MQSASDENEHLQVMTLNGVSDYKDYDSALDYLAKQPLIQQVALVAVRDNQLVLHILLSASWAQLSDALALDRKIRLLNPPEDLQAEAMLGAPGRPAQFQWLGR